MILEAKDLRFRYQSGNRNILNQFSMALGSGEILGLSAPSGFGKTTLCKILGGYIRPGQGQVLLDGRHLAEYRGYCPVQMIWQHPELVVNPRLKMAETLKEAGDLPPSILQGLGIEKAWLDRYPLELSGGELQRFCIARALGDATRFLLADEITTMLDLITQAQVWQFLGQEVRRRKLGMLVVSHSQSLLDRLCTGHIDMKSAN